MAKKSSRGRADVPLEIEVTNFGPISEGKFSLKPLTIFVGPNNAGKTFAATLAHSILSVNGEYEHPFDFARWIKKELRGKKFQALVTQMGKLVESADPIGTQIPDKYVNEVRDITLRRCFNGEVVNAIRRNFGKNLKDLVRLGQSSSTIKVNYHISTNVEIHSSKTPTSSLDFSDVGYTIKNCHGVVSLRESNRQIFGQTIDFKWVDRYVQQYIDLVSQPLKLQKKPGLLHFLTLMKRIEHLYMYLPSSFYLPAARSGLLSAHKAIVSSAMKSARFAGTTPLRIEPLTGVVSEYVESIIHMSDHGYFSNGKVEQDMFKDMFGGRLEVLKPKAGLPRMRYKIDEDPIPTNLLSSSITETASLQLFVQGKIPQTDVLVLEEPESHLHPANQARLAKHIVRLVNSGVHVLLITHGVYFLEQLSMFVRMSKITAEKRKELGYNAEDFLKTEDVAQYLFKKEKSGGFAIKHMKHTAEDGISQDEFGVVTEIMYNKEIKIERMISES